MISVRVFGFDDHVYSSIKRGEDIVERVRANLCFTSYKHIEVGRASRFEQETLPDGQLRKFLRITAPDAAAAEEVRRHIMGLESCGVRIEVETMIDPSLYPVVDLMRERARMHGRHH